MRHVWCSNNTHALISYSSSFNCKFLISRFLLVRLNLFSGFLHLVACFAAMFITLVNFNIAHFLNAFCGEIPSCALFLLIKSSKNSLYLLIFVAIAFAFLCCFTLLLCCSFSFSFLEGLILLAIQRLTHFFTHQLLPGEGPIARLHHHHLVYWSLTWLRSLIFSMLYVNSTNNTYTSSPSAVSLRSFCTSFTYANLFDI